MDEISEEDVDRYIEAYVMNGDDNEEIGYKRSSFSCPVALAIKKAFSAFSVSTLPADTEMYPNPFKTNDYRAITARHSDKVYRFINLIDGLGNRRKAITRKEAKKVWQSLAGERE